MAFGRRFFEVGLSACERLGRRAVVATRFPGELPAALPDWAIARSYVPFTDLMPRVAAVVHHGGIGTTAQALSAGVPQLVMPMSHDQPDNAARLRELGVGDFLYPGQFTPERVARKLERLLADEDVRLAVERARALTVVNDGAAALERAVDELLALPQREGRS